MVVQDDASAASAIKRFVGLIVQGPLFSNLARSRTATTIRELIPIATIKRAWL